MINILEQYRGKVIVLCLKGSEKSVYNGIVDKIDIENHILRIQSWKRYIFVDISEIAVIMEELPTHATADFDTHVVPSAFT
jgi:hypothetical protein